MLSCLLFLTSFSITVYAANDLEKSCNATLYSPVLSESVQRFWLGLEVFEQHSILKSFTIFWNHHLLRSKLPLSESYPVFVGLAEHRLGHSLAPWPLKPSLEWVEKIFEELSDLPNTDSEVKEGFVKIKNLIETHQSP